MRDGWDIQNTLRRSEKGENAVETEEKNDPKIDN